MALASSFVAGAKLRALDAEMPGSLGMPLIPPLPLVKSYAWLTAASYCNDRQLFNWDCRSCSPMGNNIRFVRGLENEQFGTRCFVAIDDSNRRILIAFRATENDKNTRQNHNLVQVPFKGASDMRIRVVRGPLMAMESLEQQILETITTMLNDPSLANHKIAFVGHSLGSSLAALAAARVKTSLNMPGERIEVYAYGMPRIGNRNFAEWYNGLGMAAARVVNKNDLFPQILGGNNDLLVHIKTELWVTGPRNNEQITICDTATLEDPKCSKSVPRSKLSKELHFYMFDVSYEGELCEN
ncbi:hypothetical protein DSO57_1016763 [Entomophthora muscae]|uniref:Uncharacterized protein n=2 Tax=Entomophthora muscae TaxID=34485 RepID=A0ACC2SH96_9FUNG|nr:hypothetical protein DSO57_1017511 [Entomophthora muscae]KAJ9061830.1 hypothetical protein DSO57_1016763 [Entomophthora muscae]